LRTSTVILVLLRPSPWTKSSRRPCFPLGSCYSTVLGVAKRGGFTPPQNCFSPVRRDSDPAGRRTIPLAPALIVIWWVTYSSTSSARQEVRPSSRVPTLPSPVGFPTAASSEMIRTSDKRESLFKNHSKGDISVTASLLGSPLFDSRPAQYNGWDHSTHCLSPSVRHIVGLLMVHRRSTRGCRSDPTPTPITCLWTLKASVVGPTLSSISSATAEPVCFSDLCSPWLNLTFCPRSHRHLLSLHRVLTARQEQENCVRQRA